MQIDAADFGKAMGKVDNDYLTMGFEPPLAVIGYMLRVFKQLGIEVTNRDRPVPYPYPSSED